MAQAINRAHFFPNLFMGASPRLALPPPPLPPRAVLCRGASPQMPSPGAFLELKVTPEGPGWCPQLVDLG